jgi:hypothetical protein
MQLTHHHPATSDGLLYPMMVIAAIAVIVFSIAGIATISGWFPNAMRGAETIVSEPRTPVERSSVQPDVQKAGPAFQCAECGVIETIREIERRGSLWAAPVERTADVRSF